MAVMLPVRFGSIYKQRRQVLLIGLGETIVRTKVQYAFIPFSRVKYLNFPSFSQIFSRIKCPILVF